MPANVKKQLLGCGESEPSFDQCNILQTNMASSGIRPDYREIKVVMSDGTSFTTRSTYEGETITLEGDITRHPAWRLDSEIFIEDIGAVAKFRKQRGAMNLSGMFAKTEAQPIAEEQEA